MKLIGGEKSRKVWERVSRLWTQYEPKIGFSTIISSRKASVNVGSDVHQVTRSRQGEAGSCCCSGSQWSNKAAFRQGQVVRRFASQGGASGTSPGGPVSYASLGITALTGAGLFYWYEQERSKKLNEISKKTVVAGTAAIGGKFDLIDDAGNPFSDEKLKGQFNLLYFGFTHCPDVCPEELEKIAEAIDRVAKRTKLGDKLLPVFITLDPERDGVAQLKEYVKEFHPRMIGLTGSPEAIKNAAKGYRVYYTRASVGEITGADAEQDENDYLIDHSIISYLVDPQGNFVTFYGKNYSAEEMADSMVSIMESWKPEE